MIQALMGFTHNSSHRFYILTYVLFKLLKIFVGV